ncbi:hypothetical protein SAMN05216588_117136 [Pseudomonas flavescens]|uniref:Lipoprotein n=1 Tax=Phytopseudomonas flavescens TaxID=29435 RepID=A0A1G8KWZ4_9GAMM|nr:hypothetical protein [Pseudomonas flavescens]SDI47944.1 hypothetical protein SAMN05216588_117136 [Pseudomonas flavescens]
MKLITTLAVVGTLLVGCAQHEREIRHGYGNDALPSAEVKAFQAADARLHYQDARIEWDQKNCALYQGIAPDGALRTVPLADQNGKPICSRP